MTQRTGNIIGIVLSALGGMVSTYGWQTDTMIATGGGVIGVAALAGWQIWKGRSDAA